ncbi:MAG: MFS transporter [Proteobacteria bacterium]|nr:MFS transporter [Pseudomonadota bacterium]
MSKSDPSFVKWREIVNRQYAVPLALVCLGVWLHAADSLLVATMMPAIVAEIGGTNLISWTVALYEIGSIVAGAASGLLALRLGIRRPMTFAALLFAAGCMVSAIAPEMWIVLLGRLMQGFGGGGLMALAFVACSQLFPERLMARALGAISTLWGVSAFTGPLIGGLFVEFSTWRGGFWFFCIQALGLALWIFLSIKEPKPTRSDETFQRFPIWRLAFLSLSVLFIAYAGVDVSIVKTPLFLIAGICFLFLFFRLDSGKQGNRLFPVTTLSLRDPVGAGLTMVLCFSIATIAVSVYGPLLITLLHGSTALEAGYIIACSSIGWSITAFFISGVPTSQGGRMIAGGMTILTLSILGFIYSVPNGPPLLIAVFTVLEGVGFGMAWTFVLHRATVVAGPAETERVSAAIPTMQRLGYALGAAYMGIVANWSGIAEGNDPHLMRDVAYTIFIACLPAAIVGLIAAFRFVRSKAAVSA